MQPYPFELDLWIFMQPLYFGSRFIFFFLKKVPIYFWCQIPPCCCLLEKKVYSCNVWKLAVTGKTCPWFFFNEELSGYYANWTTEFILCAEEERFLNEPLWDGSYLNYFSEWRKAELKRGRSKPVEEKKMLRGNESPAGIPAIHRLTIKTLIKHDPSEVQAL